MDNRQAVVTPGLQILWTFFRVGKADWHGPLVNLKTARTTPLRSILKPGRMKGEAYEVACARWNMLYDKLALRRSQPQRVKSWGEVAG